MSNQAAWIDVKGARLRVRLANIFSKLDNVSLIILSQVYEAELPKPGADDIVVKNHFVAINPVDWKIQDYGFLLQRWPNVLGTDIAGEVVDVGANVRKFKIAFIVAKDETSHTISLNTNQPADGGFQLYSRAQAVFAAIIPKSISYKDASVLPLAIDTASHGLYDSLEKGFLGLSYPSLDPAPSGKTIIIWGGSSSVGATAIQLATASGAKVVAIASVRNHEFVKSLGASAAIDYNTSSVVDDVVKAVQSIGGQFVGVYDAIAQAEGSYKYIIPIIEKLDGGVLATVLSPPENLPANIKAGKIAAINSEINGPVWDKYVNAALAQRKLRAVPGPVVVGKGLESVQKGLDANKAGVSAQKVVVEL